MPAERRAHLQVATLLKRLVAAAILVLDFLAADGANEARKKAKRTRRRLKVLRYFKFGGELMLTVSWTAKSCSKSCMEGHWLQLPSLPLHRQHLKTWLKQSKNTGQCNQIGFLAGGSSPSEPAGLCLCLHWDQLSPPKKSVIPVTAIFSGGIKKTDPVLRQHQHPPFSAAHGRVAEGGPWFTAPILGQGYAS